MVVIQKYFNVLVLFGLCHATQAQRGRGSYNYNKPSNPLTPPTTAKPSSTLADSVDVSSPSPSTSRPNRPRPQGYGSGRPPPGAPAFTYPPFSSSSQQDDVSQGMTTGPAVTLPEATMTAAGYPTPSVPKPSRPVTYPSGNEIDTQMDTMVPDSNMMSMMTAGTNYDMMTMQGDYSAIPGEPDKDYPILSEIPKTGFKCKEQKLPGYYADVEARCQVFHVCYNNLTYDFLCPNGTIFHQEYLVCVWWNQFDCSTAPDLFSINANIYDYSIKGSGVSGNIQPPYPESDKPSGPGFTLPPGGTPSSNYGAPESDQHYYASNVKPNKTYLPSRA